MENPPFTITSKAVNLIAGISALLERHNIALEGEEELRLRKANRVRTIHSSLAIEGNTLSEDEVSDILNGKPVVAPLRQIQEVKNAIKVYDLYSRLDPFSEKDLLKAHSVMMEALADDAGRYRKGGVGVFGETGLVHMAPPAHLVPTHMHNLFQWLCESADHLLVRSCVFHYEFEFIHPFSDGNGRTGRLWQSLMLGRLNPIFEHLPVENMVLSNQIEYYEAIAASNAKGDSAPFVDFMLEEIFETLKSHVKTGVPNKVPNKTLDKNDMLILKILQEDGHLSRVALMEKTGLSDGGIKKILAKLKACAAIERVGSNKTGYWRVLYNL